MGNNDLKFAIGFDLKKGVDAALREGDAFLRRMDAEFARRAIKVRFELNTQKFGAIEEVRRRLAQLKIEPITPETKSAIRELTQELQQLAKALEAVQKYSARVGSTTEAVRNSKIALNEQRAAAAHELARQRAARAAVAEEKLAQARVRSTLAINTRTRAYAAQHETLGRLTHILGTYASFRMVGSFLSQIRETTAEFELQRVSLGAIIQDQQRANQLFSEIKSFALQSPLKILDLTKYTKQVAAYGIETEKLFDTTKRLADVSVGLGVDMGRLVLAYGQVKAASYLRAAEIRQFTEAGIPMLDLLAKKFTDLQGKMVSTEQVMDLVSKRAVSFSMVEGIFNDMTSAGGMFYNMQEKQAQTLFGMWSKLGDAAAMMYDEIGNTDWVNSGMKTTIGLLESMMRNWRFVANQITDAAIAFGVFKTASTAIKWMQVNTVAAAEATRSMTRASISHRAAIAAGNTVMGAYTNMLRMVAVWNRKAALSTNLFTVAWNKLKVAMATWGPMLIITALTTIVSWFISARQEANRLNEELSKISVEGAANADAMVRNFERLANAVVESADGSKKQHEALEELKRTYSDIIPAQNLTIEKLRAMKGAYEDVAKAIREKIYQQNLERQISTIQEEYQKKLSDSEGETKKFLADYGLDANEIGQVMGAIKKAIDDGILDITSSKYEYAGVLSRIIKEQTGLDVKFDTGYNTDAAISFGKLRNSIEDYVDAYSEMTEKIKERTEYMEGQMGTLGEYTNEWKRVQKEIADNKIIAGPNDSQFLVSKQNDNRAIQSWAASLKGVLGDAWDDAFVSLEESVGKKGDKMSHILFDKLMAPEVFEKFSIQQQNYIKQIQDEYYNLIPKEAVVRSVNDRFTRLANSLGLIDKVRGDMMGASEDLEAYRKKINDTAKDYATQVEDLTRVLAMTPMVSKDYAEISDKLKDTEALKEFYTTWAKMLGESKKGGGRTSDPRLQNLKEEISLTKKLYDEYQKLEKQIGATKAAEKIQQIYSNTIKTLQDRAKKYGFEFELPFTDENLKANMQHFIDKMKELQKEVDKKGKPKFPNIGKEIDEAMAQLEDVDFNSLQKALEKKLKELADRISRTKTAKEFYEKILSQTGDVKLAAKLSLSIYGENGEDLDKAIRDNIQATLGKNKEGVDLDFSAAIRAEGSVDYNALTKLAKGYLDMGEISEEAYNKILKMRDEDRKDLAKTVEGWLKATEKAKTYSDKLLDLRRKTQTEINSINEKEARGQISPEFAESQRVGFLRKEAEEVAKLQYEAFKDSPMYVQMFDDLDNASATMLRNMKQCIEELKTSWKDLTPTQLKEMQSRLNEIDAQLAKRNPFKGLIDGIKEYRNLRKGGDAFGNRSEGAAEKALDAAAKARLEAEKEYLEILNKEGATQEEIANAKKRFDDAAADEDAAAKAVENWKKVKDAIGLSANELFQMLNWAGDIAGAIADISEAMGADEEDVQYWNDVADALGNISGGIQDIVSAAMSGNVVGIISSTLTAIPKMFVGFANLFTAGRVRRANKEIKRQQELIDQLEYTYGRLEKAADKLFGGEYLNNYNQRLKNLQAQQQAYLKQAEAERSKGKKKDKDKIKEYENQARETANAIAELQDDLAAHFTGSSRTDVARQMAKSWIDARASMSDTFAAIKGDYQDLIKNMIVEGAAARVIENALSPLWEQIEDAYKSNNPEEALDKALQGMDVFLNNANNGMEVLWKALEARGYDMKQLIGDVDSNYTGIAKEVSSATSEEINANTAALNTQNYYMSHVPQIAEHVAAMRQLMERTTTVALPEASAAGWTDWQKQAMDNYNAIARNTAETVAECRRSAAACEAMAEKMGRIIEFSGGKHRLNVKL